MTTNPAVGLGSLAAWVCELLLFLFSFKLVVGTTNQPSFLMCVCVCVDVCVCFVCLCVCVCVVDVSCLFAKGRVDSFVFGCDRDRGSSIDR